MSRTVTLFQFMPYGAPELQSAARPNMVRALLLSSTLCTLAVASVGLTQLIPHATSPPALRVITLDRMPAPPPMDRYASVPPVAPAGARRATATFTWRAAETACRVSATNRAWAWRRGR